MRNGLIILMGGGLGSLARWLVSGYVARHWGETFPWGTLFVNVTGSFAIGLLAALTGPEGRFLVPASIRQFFMLGLCGGYTTFSSFSLQTLLMAQDGQWGKASLNVVGTVVLCLGAVWLSHLLAAALQSHGGG